MLFLLNKLQIKKTLKKTPCLLKIWNLNVRSKYQIYILNLNVKQVC